MKRILLICITAFFLLMLANQVLFAQNLTSQEIIGLANKKTVEGITTLLQNKNYYLAKKSKYEGQKYGTDEVVKIVYCFNCTYREYSTENEVSYDIGTNFTNVKIFYNVTKRKIEDIDVWFSNRNVFLAVRKNLPALGYKYQGEDLVSSTEGIIYQYANAQNIGVDVLEKSNGCYIVSIIK